MPIDYDNIVTRARDRIDSLKAVQAKFPETIQHVETMLDAFRHLNVMNGEISKLDPEALAALGDAGRRLGHASLWAYNALRTMTGEADHLSVHKLIEVLQENAASPD